MMVKGAGGRKVIYLLGVPGTGKSSVGRELAVRLGGEHIDVSELVLRKGFYTAYDPERSTHVADVRRLSKFLAEKASSANGYLIVSSNFAVPAPGVKDFVVFLLRCSPLVLMKRLRERGYEDKKISDNLVAELIGLSLDDACATFGSKKVVEIDATDLGLSPLVSRITQELARGASASGDRIDWISRLERDPALDDLLVFISRHTSVPELSPARCRRRKARASLKRGERPRRASAR